MKRGEGERSGKDSKKKGLKEEEKGKRARKGTSEESREMGREDERKSGKGKESQRGKLGLHSFEKAVKETMSGNGEEVGM